MCSIKIKDQTIPWAQLTTWRLFSRSQTLESSQGIGQVHGRLRRFKAAGRLRGWEGRLPQETKKRHPTTFGYISPKAQGQLCVGFVCWGFWIKVFKSWKMATCWKIWDLYTIFGGWKKPSPQGSFNKHGDDCINYIVGLKWSCWAKQWNLQVPHGIPKSRRRLVTKWEMKGWWLKWLTWFTSIINRYVYNLHKYIYISIYLLYVYTTWLYRCTIQEEWTYNILTT